MSSWLAWAGALLLVGASTNMASWSRNPVTQTIQQIGDDRMAALKRINEAITAASSGVSSAAGTVKVRNLRRAS